MSPSLSRTAPVAAVVTAAALVGSLLLAVSQPGGAAAAEGPAPASRDYAVIADVHTDAIATFWDDGRLTLGTIADTPATHTRYDPEAVWFHVDDDSRVEDYTGRDFVAPAGSTIWRTTESYVEDALWAGFSTESVPAGTLDEDDTTLTLVDAQGPGDVEVWQNDEEGDALRLWSSDEPEFSSFTRKAVHMHANWAFTAPGAYELTVRADASVAGAAVTDTATYTFIVGDLPEQTATTTGLAASATNVIAGDPITLTATVTPDVGGAVEFRDGTTVLGHDPVDTGTASIDVPTLTVGTHTITAVFVPEVSNLATTSTSAPLDITVTEASGIPLGITGIQESYAPGDTLTATLTGYTPATGEQVRWRVRAVGSDSASGSTLVTAASLEYSTTLDVSWNAYEISAQVRQGTTPIATTDWVPVSVSQTGPEPTLALAESPQPFYQGDTAIFSHAGQQLSAGETVEYVFRTSPSARWQVLAIPGFSTMPATPLADDRMSIRIQTGCCATTRDFAIRVVSGGVAVRQSPFVRLDVQAYELNLGGINPVYRDGQTMTATATYYPVRPGVDVTWEWRLAPNGGNYATIAEGTGTPAPLERVLSLADDGSTLLLQIHRNGSFVSTATTRLTVVDGSAAQIVQLAPLPGHFHQGDGINLTLLADPPLAAGDTATWEWLWPGSDTWSALPVPPGAAHSLTAEQALAGVQVRATVDFAAEGSSPITTAPLTIGHDDHGSAPRQQPSIGGDLAYDEGETVTLTRELPANGATILTDHLWETKSANGEWTAIDGEQDATLSFLATAAADDAQYRVSILTPTGEVAYGPSPAVTLDVVAAAEFSISGVHASYRAGDALHATVVGGSLATGQTYRFLIRAIGETGSNYVTYGDGARADADQGRLLLNLGADDNGFEISAQLRGAGQTLSQTGWVPLVVTGIVDPATTAFPEGAIHLGDTLRLAVGGRQPVEGESVRLVYSMGTSPWYATNFTTVEDGQFAVRAWMAMTGTRWAVQTLRDDIVIAQSPPFSGEILGQEALLEGVRSVYRAGQTLTASGDVHPALPGTEFRWTLMDAKYNQTVLAQGPDARSIELPLTMAHNGNTLYFEAVRKYDDGSEVYSGSTAASITVSDAAPGEQLLFPDALAAHYHQGYDVNLRLVADPEIADDDVVHWEWKWPGSDEWSDLPGAATRDHLLIAEQALDGVEVRAVVDPETGGESLTSSAATIHHDDHGSPARQQPTVGGELAYAAGDVVTLTRQLPANGATVLTGHRWEKRSSGGDWSVIEGASSAELSYRATPSDDGAEVRVSILTPTGEVAYGASPAVTLDVEGSTAPVSVAIEGIEESYAPGAVVSLTAIQSTEPASADVRWFTRSTADAEWVLVDGASGSTYRFVAAATQQVKAVAYDAAGAVIAESDPVGIRLDDTGADAGIELAVSLKDTEGALVVSIAPGSERSELSDLTLNAQADRFVSEGSIGGITVTDTRADAPGWSASGRIRELGTVDGAILDGAFVGWSPKVASGASAQPGPVAAPGFVTGTGIKAWSVLGTAPAGSSTGTSVLGADLRIEAPTTTEPGDYTGVILITVI